MINTHRRSKIFINAIGKFFHFPIAFTLHAWLKIVRQAFSKKPRAWVIFYDCVDNKWKDVTHLEDNEPIFFQQILYRLSKILRETQVVIHQNID